MAQEVGDAVLRFLGDSTQLDTKFDEVGPNAQKAFAPAAVAVEQAGERMKFSMREARGEVRLLGEEFGIRLPRHVSNFITTLPGVGEAMSAAFSATAVLFIAQALAQATDKLSNFVGNTLIFTDEMRKSNEEIANENKSLSILSDIYTKAKERLDALNGATKSWEAEQRAAIQANIDGAKAQLANMEATIANKSGWDKAKDAMKDAAGTILSQVIPGYVRLATSTQEQIALEEKRGFVATVTAKALKATNEVNAEEAAKNAKLALDNSIREIENQKKIALAYAQNDQEKFELDQQFEERKLALLNEYAVKDAAAIRALMTTIEVQQIEHAQKIDAAFVNMLHNVQAAKQSALNAVKDSTLANIVELTPLQAALQKAEDAAHSMGITLRTDLVAGLEKAKQAEKDYLASGFVLPKELKLFQDEVARADAALRKFGKTEDTFLSKSRAWKQFQQDIQGAGHGIDQLKLAGATAFDDLSKNIGGAFQAIVLGQDNVVQALEKATAASLAQIASQAAVKALFYTAEGVASAFTDATAATGYFTAAAEMGAVAALAGVAGHELAGAAGGGGSTNTAQSHTSESNTSQSNRSGGAVIGIQHFATGGLIDSPTLAIMGEDSKKEAVLPLEDPRAMAQIGQAIGENGGGTTHHWHVNGMISPDNLAKVVKQISKAVDKGQVHLTATNSLRVTKRSA